MNKSMFILLALVAVVAVGSASAWHCADTDQTRPDWNSKTHYGIWGDNGLLGGNSTGWLTDLKDDESVPAGCTGTQGDYTCQDMCDGTTLREFYCGDRQPTTTTVTDCDWTKHKTDSVSTQCTNTQHVCNEQNVNKTWGNKVCVCTQHTKTTNYWGETVIFWNDTENSDQCVPNTPEFGVIAGGIALIGAVAAVVVIRRRQ